MPGPEQQAHAARRLDAGDEGPQRGVARCAAGFREREDTWEDRRGRVAVERAIAVGVVERIAGRTVEECGAVRRGALRARDQAARSVRRGDDFRQQHGRDRFVHSGECGAEPVEDAALRGQTDVVGDSSGSDRPDLCDEARGQARR